MRLNNVIRALESGEIPVTVYAARSKRELLEPYAEAGVERVVLYLPSATREELMPRIERQAKLMDELSRG